MIELFKMLLEMLESFLFYAKYCNICTYELSAYFVRVFSLTSLQSMVEYLSCVNSLVYFSALAACCESRQTIWAETI